MEVKEKDTTESTNEEIAISEASKAEQEEVVIEPKTTEIIETKKNPDNGKEESQVKDEKANTKTENKNEAQPENEIELNNSSHQALAIFGIFSFIFILIILIIFCTFTIVNQKNNRIIGGVYIKGVDVSGLSKDSAIEKVSNYINASIPEEIELHHGDFETSVSTSQLSITFNTEEAVDIAYNIGKDGNIFENDLTILKTLFSPLNVDPGFSIDHEQLGISLQDISNKLPDKITESGYYIEDDNLIITKGSEGYVVNVEASADYITENINNLTIIDNYLELITELKYPTKIDIDAIHNELYKEPVDSYFTQDPYAIYPSENGLDFAISVEEAKALLEEDQEEYSIPLQILYPNVTTNMLGTEAFPDLLSDFSTNYATSNTNRTTNLILASNKINGTVLMPGETFSYNKVVGERTIAAGYKEAAIYVQGRVEDGLGGGICQITTTLYNAALFANLEIIERSNHQFVPSYVGASRDATVVYGSIDFQFKNNRDYPIKITCSVAGGVANFKIYGLKTANDYDVQISSSITSSTSNYIYSQAYKTLYQNGVVVSTEVISRDMYKRH